MNPTKHATKHKTPAKAKPRLKHLGFSLLLGLLFLGSGPLAPLSKLKAQQTTPLPTLIEQGRLQRIKTYLRHKPQSLNQTDSYQRNALHHAAKWGRTEIIDYLLSQGAKPLATDHAGQTPLHYAASWGQSQAAQSLLNNSKTSLNIRDKEERSALALAAQYGHTKLAELLLQYGADPRQTDIYGWDTADLAFKNGHIALGQILRNAIAQKNQTEARQREAIKQSPKTTEVTQALPLLRQPSPLTERWPGTKTLEQLMQDQEQEDQENQDKAENQSKAQESPAKEVSKTKNSETPELAPDLKWTPYLLAIALNRTDSAEQIKRESPNASSQELANGWNALQVAARSGALDSIEYLSKELPLNKLSSGRQSRKTALQLAIQTKQPQAVQVLLDLGASTQTPDSEGFRPIHYAALYSPESLAIILRKDPEASQSLAPFSQSPLYLAAWKSQIPSIELLLSAGADSKQPNTEGWRPISATIQGGYFHTLDSVKILQSNRVGSAAYCGESSLHLAAKLGKVAILEQLLRQVDIDLPSGSCKQTALQLAAQNAQLPATQYLLKRGAQIEARDSQGNTALLLTRSPAIAQLLLENGANPAAQNNAGKTYLDFIDTDELQ